MRPTTFDFRSDRLPSSSVGVQQQCAAPDIAGRRRTAMSRCGGSLYMSKKITTWGIALALCAALISVWAMGASAQTYPTPCAKGEVRVNGDCVKRVTQKSGNCFINNVGKRKGFAFRRVTRNGRKFHVYRRPPSSDCPIPRRGIQKTIIEVS